MNDAGMSASGTCHIGSFSGEVLGCDHDVIRGPSLGLVRCNDVAVAPLPKICRNTQVLVGLKCAVRRDAGNSQYLSISETKPLVIGADKYLVTRADFDLPRARDIERIGAAQVEDYFFPSRKGDYDFLFLDAHDRPKRCGAVARRGKDHDLPRFLALPIPFLLTGPAKRLMDFEARSFGRKHSAFLQTFANRVSKAMILFPGKGYGQAAVKVPSPTGGAAESRPPHGQRSSTVLPESS